MTFAEKRMDSSLVNLATGLSQSKLARLVQTAVARKTLDAAKQQGAALVSLIDSAKPAQSPGLGNQIDFTG